METLTINGTTLSKKEHLDGGLFLLKLIIADRKESLKKARREKKGLDALQKCENETCTKKGIKMCASCLCFTYCSLECQKEHWKKHKPLCTELRDCMILLQEKQAMYEQDET